MEIGDLLDRAKARLHAPSERALARSLRIDPTSLLDYRRGNEFPTDERMIRICMAADVPTLNGLVALNIWRSRGEARRTYSDLLKMLGSKDFGKQVEKRA